MLNRYEVKFNNGTWKLFDNKTYKDVAVFTLARVAHVAASKQ